MDYRQARSCNKSLFPQSGITGQETKVSLSDASHRIELVQEQLAYGMGRTADTTAIPLPSGLTSAFSVWNCVLFGLWTASKGLRDSKWERSSLLKEAETFYN